MRALLVATVALLTLSCGGEDVPPSCENAVSNFYVSCTFVELETGEPVPRAEVIQFCREALTTLPPSCDDAMDDFLFCLDGAPSDCDCSREFEALFTCG
jgi:hypothetical protein